MCMHAWCIHAYVHACIYSNLSEPALVYLPKDFKTILRNYCSSMSRIVICEFYSRRSKMKVILKQQVVPGQHSSLSLGFNVSAVAVFENTGKRRNCFSWAISPFPTVFSNHLENFLSFSSNSKLSCANFFNFEESKICRVGKGYAVTL